MQTVWLQKTTYKWIGLVAGIILLLLCVAASILFGVHATAWRQVWEAFTSYNGSTEHLIVREVRVPRALIAAFVGGSLGICGVLLQSLTKNPLADSGIFGINAGASLFVVASFVLFGVSSLTSFTWIAFMGAGVSCLFVFVLGSAGRQGLTPLKITLVSAAITAFCSSMTNGMLIISGRAMEEVLFWMSGSVEGRSLDILLRLLPYMLAAWVVSILISSSVNTLMLGDDVAKSLGQKTALLKLTMGVLIVVLAGSSVAVAKPDRFSRSRHPPHRANRRRQGHPLADSVQRGDGRHLIASRRHRGTFHRHASGNPDRRHDCHHRRSFLYSRCQKGAVKKMSRSDKSKEPIAIRMRGSRISFLTSRKQITVLTSLAVLLLLAVIVSIGFGTKYVNPWAVVQGIFGQGNALDVVVVQKLRLPRVLVGAMVGACLAMSGAITQGLIRNPLASPDVMGVTSGASLAATAIITLVPSASIFWLPPAAFIGATLTTLLIYFLSWKKGVNPLMLVLVGVGIGAVASSLSTMLLVT